MDLFLSLPEFIILNELMPFLGKFCEFSNLRLVCKDWKQQVDFLLPGLVEISLIQLEKLKLSKTYQENHLNLHKLQNLQHFYEFKLRKFQRVYCHETLSYNSLQIAKVIYKLVEGVPGNISEEEFKLFVHKIGHSRLQGFLEEMKHQYSSCKALTLQILETPANFSSDSTMLLDILNGLLKIVEVSYQIGDSLGELIQTHNEVEFLNTRIKQISRLCGFCIN